MSSDDPITGLYLVRNPRDCPPGYDLIEKTSDGDAAKIQLRTLLAKRNFFICFKKKNGSVSQNNDVVADIVILGKEDDVPQGYTKMDVLNPSLLNALFSMEPDPALTAGATIGYSAFELPLPRPALYFKLLPKFETPSAVTEIRLIRSHLFRETELPQHFVTAGEFGRMNLSYKRSPLNTTTNIAGEDNDTSQEQEQRAKDFEECDGSQNLNVRRRQVPLQEFVIPEAFEMESTRSPGDKMRDSDALGEESDDKVGQYRRQNYHVSRGVFRSSSIRGGLTKIIQYFNIYAPTNFGSGDLLHGNKGHTISTGHLQSHDHGSQHIVKILTRSDLPCQASQRDQENVAVDTQAPELNRQTNQRLVNSRLVRNMLKTLFFCRHDPFPTVYTAYYW